jgi:hypothetical protein
MRSDFQGQEIRAYQRLLTIDTLRNLGVKNNLLFNSIADAGLFDQRGSANFRCSI